MQIEYSQTRNINLLADRIGVTVSSPILCSSINHFKGGKTYTAKNPKEITDYMRERMEMLKSKYEIEDRREHFPGKKSVWGYGIKLNNMECVPEEFRDATVRVIAWHPFSIIFYPNFNRYMARYCSRRNISYTLTKGHDNAFEKIELSRQVIFGIMDEKMGISNLFRELIVPVIREIFPDLAHYYENGKVSYNQFEVSHDILMNSEGEATETLVSWIKTNIIKFTDSKFKWEGGKPFFNSNMNGLRFKAYTKDRVIRFELTYDTKYMKHENISRVEIRQIINHAHTMYEKISMLTAGVRVTKRVSEIPNLRKIARLMRTEKDVKVLETLKLLSLQTFKNEDIQKISGLNRNQVYYRLKEKMFWLFDKESKAKWRLKTLGLSIIKLLLIMLKNMDSLIQQISVFDAEIERRIDVLGIHDPNCFGKVASLFEFV